MGAGGHHEAGDVRLDRQLVALLNQVSFGGGELNGRFAGRIPTPDAARHPHDIRLQLRLRDGKLRGQATAQSTDDPGYFGLSSYVELEKAGGG